MTRVGHAVLDGQSVSTCCLAHLKQPCLGHVHCGQCGVHSVELVVKPVLEQTRTYGSLNKLLHHYFMAFRSDNSLFSLK